MTNGGGGDAWGREYEGRDRQVADLFPLVGHRAPVLLSTTEGVGFAARSDARHEQ